MQWLPAILILPYFIVLLKIYKSLVKIKPFSPTASPGVFISVIVACKNEQEHLPHLIKSISEQDYPPELFEVIIVDDNSTDRTAEIPSDFQDEIRIFTIKNRSKGKKHAIGTGISLAKGSLIVTTDADCRMGRSWLRTIAGFYAAHKPDMIICPVRIDSSAGFSGIFQELEFLSLQGITAGTAYSGQGTMCNGANLAFTREAYINNVANLHFEIATGDDVFFLHSLKKIEGTRILWLEARESVVDTCPARDISSYFRQRRRWISKSKAYSDPFSVFLGTITFIAVLGQAILTSALIADRSFLWPFLAGLFVKSIPDFLILYNTCSRYGKTSLMKWFLPSQVVYPFYVLSVVLYSLVFPSREEH